MLPLGVVVAILIVCALLADLQLVPYRSGQFEGKLEFEALHSVVVEKMSLDFLARADREKAEGLVEAEVVQSFEDYISNDDDIVAELSPTFGLLEIHDQNVRRQR
jgi:hypothetical protein